jgi:hypothetical protein
MTKTSIEPRSFVARASFVAEHPHAIALSCSDGRFTRAVEELLESRGHARLDTVTLPGGPALLDVWSASFSDNEALAKGTSFLVKGHAIRHAYLIAHEGCGYYRARSPDLVKSHARDRQVADLRAAARWFRDHHPGVTVELYYARPQDGRVAFDAVSAA